MSKPLRILAAAAALLLSATAMAQTSTRTYPNLRWGFTTDAPGFTGCNLLALDATGGVTSVQYSVYGYLFCPAAGGSFLSDGNAYFDAAGGFNIQARLGVSATLLCTGLSGSNFSGACNVYNNSGVRTGGAFINFQ